MLDIGTAVYTVITCGTCCLEGWSGHGLRYMEKLRSLMVYVHMVYEILKK
ncbi:hypothetical protein HanXRQr2_Chr09g0365411 [Helianthus annuus]|uniref:Uncharacterized protein n=1 Tax=Helianthus annuus TaxID=4232 RepID=A0A9K3I1V0_HELAN|nr:hypothetical protein HanXRQr2_Chr09g0365411 [Helianthus annuus]KAJ0891301.1 hypothetical protein HanPSC8_Chr09g0352101 [Helianthus annuus]